MSEEIAVFCDALSEEDIMLIALRDELYGGLWDKMRESLQARLADKPYIHKIAARIESDTQRIIRMQNFEIKHRVNLTKLLESRKNNSKRKPWKIDDEISVSGHFKIYCCEKCGASSIGIRVHESGFGLEASSVIQPTHCSFCGSKKIEIRSASKRKLDRKRK